MPKIKRSFTRLSRSLDFHKRKFSLCFLSVTMLIPILVFTTLLHGAVVTPKKCGRADGGPKHGRVFTAWRDGHLDIDVHGVVSRSDIVLGQPNIQPEQSMPLGNGRLGVAVWSADGIAAQINRSGAFPGPNSSEQVSVPGLHKLMAGRDYKGRLDLYDGMLRESGNGMTATSYVRADKDEFVIDVTGADPTKEETVELRLWKPRNPHIMVAGQIAVLSDTWEDDNQPGASGQTFGTLAALTVGGRQVRASIVNPLAVEVAFRPHRDGSYRVVVAAPHWNGGDPMATAYQMLSADADERAGILRNRHLAWWHRFWASVGLMKLTSSDGSAQYMENLRTIYLYTAAAEDRATFPGSHYGNGGLFSWSKDSYQASYWNWNLRMQVAANLGAGASKLNKPYFRLYRENLVNLKAWTKKHMEDRPGICVPETMRFNGKGIEYETSTTGASIYLDCDASSQPMWNARTLSTGAEVSIWIWRQYLYTGDRAFLSRNYPIMSNSARFLLAYAKAGPNGYLHTDPSNAHETQWDVKDPTTDIAAMKALFPVVIQAATLLHRNLGLVAHLEKAIPHLLLFPRTDAATHTKLLLPSDDLLGKDVIGPSYKPDKKRENVENIGLEPVWPYEVIRLNQPRYLALARRTFSYRVTRDRQDWSYDAVDAARLGLASSVRRNLIAVTKAFQVFPSGLSDLYGAITPEPFVEQSAIVALALQEALVQEDRGVLHIARAWPKEWEGSGTVYIRGGSEVSVQMHAGIPTTVCIQAESNDIQPINNPWPGQRVKVIETLSPQYRRSRNISQRTFGATLALPDGQSGRQTKVTVKVYNHAHRHKVERYSTSAVVFTLSLHRGASYLIERVDEPTTAFPFAPVEGKPAASYKTLGPVSIGIAARAASRKLLKK
jgi:alpha-L-fucosidase 2